MIEFSGSGSVVLFSVFGFSLRSGAGTQFNCFLKIIMIKKRATNGQ